VEEPKAVKRADGKWDVTVPVEAKKFYAGGKGEEKEAPLADRINIGLFTAEPGRGTFDAKNVIRMEPQPVRSGKQVLRFVTDKKPTHAGVDPTISTSTAIRTTTSRRSRAEAGPAAVLLHVGGGEQHG
jgi:hypothetical protein